MTKEKEQRPNLGFARKYRPQNFDDIVGQEAVSTTLKNALTEKSPAHAYLFFGPRGIGKTTTARILAKALNCRKGPTPKPCGECDPCLEIAKSSAIDVLELDAATHTQVDRIREMIIETVSLAPSRDRFKVFIIDEVHMLSISSFNALLKTLEEPPAHVVFILATTDPQKVPPTIVSRCQRFRFRPLSVDLLLPHLQHLCKAEGIQSEPAALQLLARAAAGSGRDAVSLLEQAYSYADGKLTVDKIREILGSLPEQSLLDLSRCILEKDAPGLSKALETIWEEGVDGGQLLRDLRDRLHEAHLSRLGVFEALSDEWGSLIKPYPPETFSYLTMRINKILENLRIADSPSLTLEMGLYGLLEAAYDLKGLVQRLEALERRTDAPAGSAGVVVTPVVQTCPQPSKAAAPVVPPRPMSSVPKPSLSQQPAPSKTVVQAQPAGAQPGSGDVWPALLGELQKDKPGLAHDLAASRLIQGEGPWRLQFKRSFELERAKSNQALIEAKLASISGRNVRLKLEIDEKLAKDGAPSSQAEPQLSDSSLGQGERKTAGAQPPAWTNAQEEVPHEDPGVQKVLQIFPGTVKHAKKK